MARVSYPGFLRSAVLVNSTPAATAIDLGSSSSYALSTGSISFWGNISATSPEGNSIILRLTSSSPLVGVLSQGGQLMYQLSGFGTVAFGSAGQYNNAWHHYVITWGAGGENVFVDGVAVYQFATPVYPSFVNPDLILGSQIGQGYPTQCLFSEPAIYSASLTQTDAAALYSGKSPTTRTGYVAWWPTTESSGTTLNVAGSGVNGTLNAGASFSTPLGRVAASGRGTAPAGVSMVARGDGTQNSVVSCGSSSSWAMVGAFSTWLYTPQIGTGNSYLLLCDGTTNNAILFGDHYGSSFTIYGAKSGSQFFQPSFGSAASAGAFQHCAFTWSAAGYTVWLDGVSVATSSANNALTLGASPTLYFVGCPTAIFAQYCTGYVALPALYTSLSQADVTALYAGAMPSTRAGHIASWPGKDKYGSSSLAVVGSGNVATLGSTTKLVNGLLRPQASGRVSA